MTRFSRGVSDVQEQARGKDMTKLPKSKTHKTKITAKKSPMDSASVGRAALTSLPMEPGMKKGGSCKGYAKGGAIDGMARKGKTKGKFI